MDIIQDFEKKGVFCKAHNYAAGPEKLPTSKCVQCWRAFYTYMASAYPPDVQMSFLNELYKNLSYIAEHPQEADIRRAPFEIQKEN